MNKSSPEYIRVREEIAKYLSNTVDSDDYVYWDNLNKLGKGNYLAFADSILSIKGIAILA